MSDHELRGVDDVRGRERDFGGRLGSALEPYWSVADELVGLNTTFLDQLGDGDPVSEHAVALIAARLATELRAVQHLVSAGYPVQAFTIVGSMLELMHTAAYIGGDDGRAREYFEHTDKAQAYPGGVKKTIKAVGKELGMPEDVVTREYDTFYNQMCLVKHGNPMAMSLGTIFEDGEIGVVIGPVFTEDSVRLAFAAAQHAVRYVLLVSIVFSAHHIPDDHRRDVTALLTELSDRWATLNDKSARALSSTDVKRAFGGGA